MYIHNHNVEILSGMVPVLFPWSFWAGPGGCVTFLCPAWLSSSRMLPSGKHGERGTDRNAKGLESRGISARQARHELRFWIVVRHIVVGCLLPTHVRSAYSHVTWDICQDPGLSANVTRVILRPCSVVDNLVDVRRWQCTCTNTKIGWTGIACPSQCGMSGKKKIMPLQKKKKRLKTSTNLLLLDNWTTIW